MLNMKPTEILSMIEEAAGTRMFEDRRDKALKTMAKKDKKVEEINDLLREEIEPKLEKLRMEKRAFLDFQQTQSDLERITKIVVAHDYLKNQVKKTYEKEVLCRANTKIGKSKSFSSRSRGQEAARRRFERVSKAVKIRDREPGRGH